MYVGVAKLSLAVPNAHSLKEKRMVIRRVKDRVRERIGVAINEVGELDVWQRAELGVAIPSADRGKALELIDQVVREVMNASGGQVVAVAKDAWTFDAEPAPMAVVDERTGSGDKAAGQGDAGWIPDEWRDDLDR
jgi:uncharacterized protein YlxP (DUF503 family)